MSFESPDTWFQRFPGSEPGRPRLLCFPHAGGAAAFYFPLAQHLAPRLAVSAVQYPGRHSRYREPLVDDIGVLADRICAALEADGDEEPYAFFGHSMGAVVAFEVARRLKTEPVRLIVSGRRAPSRYRPGAVHMRDDEGLVNELMKVGGTDPRFLADPELRAGILPIVRNDYRAVETYRSTDPTPLTCPITALVGELDPQTSVDDAQAWVWHTTGGLNLRVFPGGHFYLNAWPEEVATEILTALAPAAIF
ncbi:thioesterase [Dactylosporangium vinaceum]|uniref:Thioesterase II family protein n=1 Tax=Dactylosporangium vinaceum TaxID=53362 RepID=A0ABV5LY02_9ACTN|nr:alpha/beta fold hydrolase [Dactylosporangium vinaceum]UAB97641.1 thioesterase [Dactylosporangium vinaceum]